MFFINLLCQISPFHIELVLLKECMLSGCTVHALVKLCALISAITLGQE